MLTPADFRPVPGTRTLKLVGNEDVRISFRVYTFAEDWEAATSVQLENPIEYDGSIADLAMAAKRAAIYYGLKRANRF